MRRLKAALARLLWGPPTTGRRLALVIPVHDDPGGLDRLLAQAQRLGVFDQIVVVDDGSSPAVPARPGVTLIRQTRARGSGVARNRGLRAVTTDYVLFFDADDALTAELPLLLADLGDDLAHRPPFDICLFRHADSRVTAEGLWGQPDWDERFWAEAGIGPGVLSEPDPATWPVLAQTANYPWNRIYRTQFLRRHRVACAPTMVHNDLPLHWLGLMRARRLLVSGRICAVHHVAPAVGPGRQLTHRAGAVRLQLFDALKPVLRAARGRTDWQAALRRFLPGLVVWSRARVDAGHLAAFDARARAVMAGLGGDVAGGAARIGQRPVRASPRTDGGDARTPPGYLEPKDAGGAIAFVLLLRDAGSTLADLARDLATVAGLGDHVIIIDDSGDSGGDDSTAPRLGRFLAEEGFPCPVTVRVTGGRGEGDLGVAINLGLAELAVPGAGRDRVLHLAGGTRIDRGAFRALRAGAVAPLTLVPWAQWDLDLGRPVPVADGAAPPLQSLLITPDLLAGLRADAGRGSDGDMGLVWHLLQRSPLTVWDGPELGHRPALPDPGPAWVRAAADLCAADPRAAPWVAARLDRDLAGLAPGARGAVITQGLAGLAGRTDLPGGLLAALARGDRAAASALLPRPAAPALQARAPLRLHLAGRHARVSPFGHAHLAPLWDGAVTLLPDPDGADLILWANPRDPAREMPMPTGIGQALLSEEPFWDTVFGRDPLARTLTVTGPEGPLRLPQVNHHRSAIFAFDRLPWYPLTDPRFADRYARLFVRNARLSPDDWRARFTAAPLRVTFMAERRPEPFHDVVWPPGDIIGLAAWRTRLALAPLAGPVARIGASWGDGASRFASDDWHGDKIARLDGQVQILSALENTHQPDYLSEKLFDAFAVGARPLYLASPGHRIHDLGLPADAWLNLWGMTEDQAAALLDGAAPDAAFLAAYAQAQGMLAALWTDARLIAAERARMGAALVAEVGRLADLVPP